MTIKTLIDKQWRTLTHETGKPLISRDPKTREATTGRFMSPDGRHIIRLIQPSKSSKIIVKSLRNDADAWAISEFESAYCGNNAEQVARCVLGALA